MDVLVMCHSSLDSKFDDGYVIELILYTFIAQISWLITDGLVFAWHL